MKRLKILMIIALTVFLGSALDSSANSINVGVPDAGLIARDTRDGASGITFIDLDSKVSGNGWITSWSIYARQYIVPTWDATDSSSRQVGLMFFRQEGSDYRVVGKSPLETIPDGGWDKIYTFNLAPPIQVAQNDYLGFYYPFQGADYPGPGKPGGVIPFSSGDSGHDVRWNAVWGNGQGELSLNQLVPAGWFSGSFDNDPFKKRLYSINATGTTTLTPIPSAAWLLGSGLMALVGLRRKLKK